VPGRRLVDRKVFEWRRFRSWSLSIQRKIPALFDARMKELLVKSKASFGDASRQWLIDASRKVNGQSFNALEELIEAFSSIYSAVRLYHGTRVEDPEVFRRIGIIPSDIQALNRRASEVFGESERLYQAIEELQDSEYANHNKGKIFVCLDPEECLTYEYCWRGSEYLRTIGNRIGKSEILGTVGAPILLGFDLSTEELGLEIVRSIAGQAVGSIYENWRKPGNFKRPIPFGFGVTNPVLPWQIKEVRLLQRYG
jgi:hypothetical protein